MKEFLVPSGNEWRYSHDPYTMSGAYAILHRYKEEVKEMLIEMRKNDSLYVNGKTFLAQSPLARKPWVAAAMKTHGLVREQPSKNGACALVLTDKARELFG